MNYDKDPILPYVVKTINETVDKFSKISPAEQDKMVSINSDQMDAIRATDARARDEFLQNEPKIDGSLKNNEIVSRILERWGKWLNDYFNSWHTITYISIQQKL